MSNAPQIDPLTAPPIALAIDTWRACWTPDEALRDARLAEVAARAEARRAAADAAVAAATWRVRVAELRLAERATRPPTDNPAPLAHNLETDP